MNTKRMNIFNKYKDHSKHVMYEIYHWEAHPSQNDDSHEFEEIPGDWWFQQPFTKPSGLEHRLEHYEVYKDYYDEIKIPCLVDDGADGNNPSAGVTGCIVSKKFRAMYTSIVCIGLDSKVAFAAHWPPDKTGNWTDAKAKEWVEEEYANFDEYLKDVLSGIDGILPVVEVTSPEADDDLAPGDDHEIKWTATDNSGEVVSRAIFLSTDDGATWELIDSADGNTGTYSWEVPTDTVEKCKIKVDAYDAAENAGSDESEVFSIGGTGIIYNLSEASKMITISKNAESYTVYIPFPGSYTVVISDVRGKQLTSFTTSNGRGWYNIPVSHSSGMHILSIRTPGKTIVRKFWFVR